MGMRRAAQAAQGHWRACAATVMASNSNCTTSSMLQTTICGSLVQAPSKDTDHSRWPAMIMRSSSSSSQQHSSSRLGHQSQGITAAVHAARLASQPPAWGAQAACSSMHHIARMSTQDTIASPSDRQTPAVIPRVLISDPWPAPGAVDKRRLALQACLSVLKQAGYSAALSTGQVMAAVRQLQGGQGSQDMLKSEAHARQLLEHLRHKRLIYGRSNPEAVVAPGHPDYPYLYTALPFQSLHKGSPAAEEKRLALQQQRTIKQAQKRVRRGKAPFPIHRKPALSSCFQQALAYEQATKALAQHQTPRLGPSA